MFLVFSAFYGQGLGCFSPDWAGLEVIPASLSSCQPPRSVLGHGLGNRAAKLGHGAADFSCSFVFALPTPSSAPGRGNGPRVIWLLILWHKTVCCFAIFFVMLVLLSSCLLYVFSARHSPPLGIVGGAPFPLRIEFGLSPSRPSHHAGGPCGRVLTLVSITIVPAFL